MPTEAALAIVGLPCAGFSRFDARLSAMEIEMSPPTTDQLFQIAIFLASACAGVFWMASANGSTVAPWRRIEKVAPELLSVHQAKWNAMAAAATGVTALLQRAQILSHMPLP
jgi:hypothetical protein